MGKPANFKGPNNRVPAEVELTRHVTLTVHTTKKGTRDKQKRITIG